MPIQSTRLAVFLLLLSLAGPARAATQQAAEAADKPQAQQQDKDAVDEVLEQPPSVSERIQREEQTERDPFALQAHRPTYIMPFTYVSNLNRAPYGAEGQTFRHAEMQFQLSIKFPVWKHPFGENSRLSFGYTQRAFWQAYDRKASSPFRETDHEPELMLDFLTDFHWLGFRNRVLRLGLDHQSNGQPDPLSRSWNRLYAEFIVERGGFAISFKPWYRLPEATGKDDNPDIAHYLGHGELRLAFKRGDNEYSMMLRNNLNINDNKGAIQLGWSFPLDNKLRGYVQVFHGYGESLIDYNVKVTRIGFGVMLTSWL